MRTSQYLKDRNIAFHTVILLCSYHNLKFPNINRKLTQYQIELFDLTLSKPEFEELYKINKQQIANAILKLKNLESTADNKISENEYMEAIFENIKLLLKHNYFSKESTTILNSILSDDIHHEEKINLIKKHCLVIKKEKEDKKRVNEYKKKKDLFQDDNIIFLNEDNSWKSAYGNSYEAYVAYWNTD